jgi:hypothetical protein
MFGSLTCFIPVSEADMYQCLGIDLVSPDVVDSSCEIFCLKHARNNNPNLPAFVFRVSYARAFQTGKTSR